MKYMNSLALFSALFLVLSSCSNDDAPPVDTSEKDAAVGTYSLSELTISSAQDINGNGSTTTDVLSELPCATGTLSLRSDDTFTWNFIGVNVTAITGDLYAFSCNSDTTSLSGFWTVVSGTVTLGTAGTSTTFNINGNDLTATASSNLPGFTSTVYSK